MPSPSRACWQKRLVSRHSNRRQSCPRTRFPTRPKPAEKPAAARIGRPTRGLRRLAIDNYLLAMAHVGRSREKPQRVADLVWRGLGLVIEVAPQEVAQCGR